MDKLETIISFDGKYAFLSNFFYAPFVYEDNIYPTNEHFFQAMKTLDPEERRKIAEAKTPGVAKRLGRRVQLREDWEEVKIDIMRLGLSLKFHAHMHLIEKLIETGDADLIEGNTWHDNFWGICLCPKCQGRGQNHLGRLLMEVRERFREEIEHE